MCGELTQTEVEQGLARVLPGFARKLEAEAARYQAAGNLEGAAWFGSLAIDAKREATALARKQGNRH